jgi:hypothetical protein
LITREVKPDTERYIGLRSGINGPSAIADSPGEREAPSTTELGRVPVHGLTQVPVHAFILSPPYISHPFCAE